MVRAGVRAGPGLDPVAIVDGTVPCHFGVFMSLIKGMIKTAVVIKLAEVAQRELQRWSPRLLSLRSWQAAVNRLRRLDKCQVLVRRARK